jgi:intracellular sulfur oxidation DsrE/DsrF family protein
MTLFARLRRRRSPAPAQVPQCLAEPPLAAAPLVDAKMLVRIERSRAALGRIMELDQSAEPAWFARVRTGEAVSLTADQWQQVSDYLQGIPAEFALSDSAVADLLERIEVAEELMELRQQGVSVLACRGSVTSAAAARDLLAIARQAQANEAHRRNRQLPPTAAEVR